jgi:transposase, IS5 family
MGAIRAQTVEKINWLLLASARQEKLESGKVVRVDSTVTAALIHEPSDSSLLWIAARLLQQADAQGRATSRGKEAGSSDPIYPRTPETGEAYRELLKITRTTLSYLEQAVDRPTLAASPAVELWQAQVCHCQPLIKRIINQTERRVLAGEPVPAGEKLVSLFEPHVDIIVKGSRDVDYGHRLNLTTGRSGLILDLVIEAGNPTGSERFLPMLERHIACGRIQHDHIAAKSRFAP